jgi:hypothetical protein
MLIKHVSLTHFLFSYAETHISNKKRKNWLDGSAMQLIVIVVLECVFLIKTEISCVLTRSRTSLDCQQQIPQKTDQENLLFQSVHNNIPRRLERLLLNTKNNLTFSHCLNVQSVMLYIHLPRQD